MSRVRITSRTGVLLVLLALMLGIASFYAAGA